MINRLTWCWLMKCRWIMQPRSISQVKLLRHFVLACPFRRVSHCRHLFFFFPYPLGQSLPHFVGAGVFNIFTNLERGFSQRDGLVAVANFVHT